MAAKKSDPSDALSGDASRGHNQQIIEDRRKAKEEAVNQTGVEPPAPVDVNDLPENPETRK